MVLERPLFPRNLERSCVHKIKEGDNTKGKGFYQLYKTCLADEFKMTKYQVILQSFLIVDVILVKSKWEVARPGVLN